MSIRKAAMATIVAFSMVAMPTVVQAAQANQAAVSKLSVARQGATVAGKKEDLRGGSIIIALLAAAAVIGGIIIASDGSNKPSSP